MSLIQGPEILDVGCGGGPPGFGPRVDSPGWMHGVIRSRWHEVWGVESDSQKVAMLAAAGFTNVHQGTAESFALDHRFDTVVAGEVIEHIGHPAGLFDSAAAHLKPGGRLILTTPYPFGLPNILYGWVKYPRTCSNPEHTMWFCPTTLRQLGERLGWRAIHHELVNDLPEGAGRLYRGARPLFRLAMPILPVRMKAAGLVMAFERS